MGGVGGGVRGASCVFLEGLALRGSPGTGHLAGVLVYRVRDLRNGKRWRENMETPENFGS